jgi:hypothetical protein
MGKKECRPYEESGEGPFAVGAFKVMTTWIETGQQEFFDGVAGHKVDCRVRVKFGQLTNAQRSQFEHGIASENVVIRLADGPPRTVIVDDVAHDMDDGAPCEVIFIN